MYIDSQHDIKSEVKDNNYEYERIKDRKTDLPLITVKTWCGTLAIEIIKHEGKRQSSVKKHFVYMV